MVEAEEFNSPKETGCAGTCGPVVGPRPGRPPGRGCRSPDREGPCQNLESGENPKAPGEAVAVAADPVPQTVEDEAPVAGASHTHNLRKRRRQDGEMKDLHEIKSSKTNNE